MKQFKLMQSALMMGLVFTLAACSEDKGETMQQAAAGESFICIEQLIDGGTDNATAGGATTICVPRDKWHARM